MSAVKQLQTFTVIMYVVFSSSTDTNSGGRAQAGNNTKKPWGCINAYKELFLNYYTYRTIVVVVTVITINKVCAARDKHFPS